ncbi:TonB-dependent siderophore receptor [Siccirubricoccus sp. KC 17139]|uniref:TonB-dependent siderophore receptor n=1 Tax=Siccirubricoccus soli TaxID=2899147 RepID=A0ABT1D1C8_9PROT|nr:TonB-dependent siderophore receptor [Siccirubricoccus soli]MCO6415719.1 TonB-dependent siderophore receptor [Siccirubricoccus soli]MCP2681851.1 TonB-dependent siderophore receptor [Siccirubricoccus soli]
MKVRNGPAHGRPRGGALPLIAALFGGSALLASPASGQTGAGQMPEGAIALPEVRIDAGLPRGWAPVRGFVAETTATGTKTDTPLIEAPQSISVVTRDQIEALSAQNLNGIMRYTPGVAVDTRGTVGRLDQFTIRGFSAPQFLDGMRTFGGRDANPSVDPYRLERVEVLRGPASVTYGQAGPGGLVNLVSKRPTLEPQRELMLQGGSFGTFRAGADLSGALNENRTLLGRIVSSYSRSDTQTEHAREERYLVAPSLTLRPTADTTITFLGLYQRDPWGGTYGGVPAYGSVLPSPYGRTRTNFWDGDPSFDRLDRTQYQLGYAAEHRFSENLVARQNFRWAHTDFYYRQANFTSLSADFRTAPRGLTGTEGNFDTITLDNQIEGRVETGPVSHTILGGLDYFNLGSDTRAGSVQSGVPSIDIYAPVYGVRMPNLAYSTRTRQTQSGVGLYAQDQLRWGPVTVHLGGRQDWYDSETRATNLTTGATTRTPFETSAFTGRAAILYHTGIGVVPYYSYTESFEPQTGTFAPARGGGPFQPTTGQQHEIGIRYQPEGVNALFTAAVFDLRRQNVLTTDPQNISYSIQTGEIRTRGVELEARATLATGVNLVASYTYLDSEYTSSNSLVTVDRGVGTRTSTRPQAGTEPTSVPNHMASIFAQYTFQPDTRFEGMTVGGGVRYVGQSWGDAANTLRVPDVTLVDLMARYELGNLSPSLRGSSLQLNVSNLFDEKYVSSCLSYTFCFWGYRRSVIATLRHQF